MISGVHQPVIKFNILSAMCIWLKCTIVCILFSCMKLHKIYFVHTNLDKVQCMDKFVLHRKLWLKIILATEFNLDLNIWLCMHTFGTC